MTLVSQQNSRKGSCFQLHLPHQHLVPYTPCHAFVSQVLQSKIFSLLQMFSFPSLFENHDLFQHYPLQSYFLYTLCSVDNLGVKRPTHLTLNAPITTKVVCFSRLLKCLKASIKNSVGPDQTAPIGAVCSGSTMFVSIHNSSVMLGNYLQQTTPADDIFRCIFLLGALRVKSTTRTALKVIQNF